jgi:hypothetical protein
VARVPITVMGCRCDRCGYEWIPREVDAEPRVCPGCHSPYWNQPRRKGEPMLTYEQFRDAIKAQLVGAGASGTTWTEIRTGAKLPQALPNNQWVRRLETDIGLERKKDTHGIIRWSLRYS